MRGKAWFLASAFLTFATAAGAATVLAVSSGSLREPVAPFETVASAEDFYGFQNFEANPPFVLQPGRLHIYLHRQTGSPEISLGFIFNTNDGADPGQGGVFEGGARGAPVAARPLVADDAFETFGWLPSDPLDGAATVNGDYAFFWGAGFTDGFVLALPDAVPWEVTLTADRLTGISETVFLSGDPLAPTVLPLESPLTTPLTIYSTPMDPVPLPAGGALLMVGLVCLRMRCVGAGKKKGRAVAAHP